MITVFSTPTCGACKKAKKYMTDNGIPFVERDITQDVDAYDLVVNKLQIRSVPVLYVDDNNYSVGFDVDKVDELAKL